MKNQITKSPWLFEKQDSNTKNSVIYTIDKPEGIANVYPCDETQATAKLIAAAPELLQALTMLKNSFIHSDKENIKGNKAKTDMIKYNDEVKEALNFARIILDKAKGE